MRRPTRRVEREPTRDEPRVNDRIRVPRVLVIDEEGNRLGEFMTQDAIDLAHERGQDLVEVAPLARPPVCRLTDFGRLKYDKKKKESQARKNQVTIEIKEIKLRPKTDDHDFEVKLKHARRFLDEGDKVKVTVRFRGRELAHREIGEQQAMALFKACEDLGRIGATPKMEGRQLSMMIDPIKKKVAPSSPAPSSPSDQERNIDVDEDEE